MKNNKYDKFFVNFKKNKYWYDFDGIVHDYLIKDWLKLIKGKNCLEIGVGSANFTKKILSFFQEVICVDPSFKSLNAIKKIKSKKINIYRTTIEKFKYDKKFDNIFALNVLEHCKNDLSSIKIMKNLLSKKGRLFIAVPNSEAGSRQIAKEMGILNSIHSLTDFDKKVGHYRTYNLKKLKVLALKAKLKIVLIGGVIFKGLANYQIDKCLKKKIIDLHYINGCYKLSKKIPEYSATIFVVCEKK